MRYSRRAITVLAGSAAVVGLFGPDVMPPAAAQVAPGGTFVGNGKPATLTQVTARNGDPQSGKPVTVLVFSEKSQGNDSNPAFNALFNKFGAAIVAKVFADGKVYSVDLVHPALDAPGGSVQVFGVFKIDDFATAGGEMSGRLTSGGEHADSHNKWTVDIKFKVKAP